jgi:putative effector of murein hydrolase
VSPSAGEVLASAAAVGGTAVAFLAADRVAARLGRPALANPVAWATVAVLVALAGASVPVDEYVDAAEPVRWALVPATVALAVPLAREARRLRAGGWRLVAAVAAGGAVASGVAAGVAVLAGTPTVLVEALAAKSVTTPIAVALVPGGGTDGLVAALVVGAGVYGAIVGPPLARRLGLDAPEPLGLGVGTVAHAIGTAELGRRSPRAVGYGVLGLVLNGVLTALWLPPLLAVV